MCVGANDFGAPPIPSTAAQLDRTVHVSNLDRSPMFRRRCVRCGRRASVVYGNMMLCGDCFLEQTKRRYGLKSKPADGLKAAATPS
jgi:ribosomal protein S14